jgi:hypothetical protein
MSYGKLDSVQEYIFFYVTNNRNIYIVNAINCYTWLENKDLRLKIKAQPK